MAAVLQQLRQTLDVVDTVVSAAVAAVVGQTVLVLLPASRALAATVGTDGHR